MKVSAVKKSTETGPPSLETKVPTGRFWEALETPVGFPELPRRKLLIPYYITNYAYTIFFMGYENL
jgi:hypothetical protein